jgi:hypothetical protein
MSFKDTQADAICAATKGTCTIQFSQNPPFIEVSLSASNKFKFKDELNIIRSYFARNPLLMPPRLTLLKVMMNEIEVVVVGRNQPPEVHQ